MKKIAFLAVIFAFCAFALNLATAQSEKNPQSFVENLVRRFIVADGRDVRFDSLDIALNGNVTAKGITVYDADGAWLQIDGLALDWQPLSLLGSTVRIDRFSIDALDVKRLPKPSEKTAPAAQSTDEPVKPKPFVIEEFELKSISLGAPVAGQAVRLGAKGTASTTLDPTTIAIDIRAQRLDEIAANLAAKVAYSPQEETLDVDVALTEAAGGVIARLLPVDGEPAIDLAIKGAGPLDDWAGQLDFSLDSNAVMAGQMEIAALRDGRDGRSIRFDLASDLAQLVPPAARVFVAGRSTLNGGVDLLKGGEIALDRVVVRSATLDLSASGKIDTKGAGNNLTLAAKLTPQTGSAIEVGLAGGERVAIGAGALDATLEGSLEQPAWTLRGNLASFSRDGARLDDLALDGGSCTTGGDIGVRLSGILTSPPGPSWPDALSGPFMGSLTASYGPDAPFTLTSADLAFQDASVRLSGAISPSSGRIDIALSGEVADFFKGEDTKARLFAGRTALSGKISRPHDRAPVTIRDLAVENGALRAAISGAYGPEEMALRTSARLNDLALLNEKAKGTLDLDANLSGAVREPVIDASLSGAQIVLSGQRLDDFSASLKGIVSGERPRFDLALRGRYRNAPLQASATVKTGEDGTRLLENLAVALSGARIGGALALGKDGLPTGNVDFAISDLSSLGDLALIDLDGALDGAVSLTRNGSALDASVKADGRSIAYETVSLKTVAADIAIRDLLGIHAPKGNVSAEGVKAGGNDLGAISTRIETGSDGYRLHLTSDGRDLAIVSEALVEQDANGARITLSKMDGKAKSISFTLRTPTSLTISGGKTVLAQTRLSVGGGSIDAEGVLAPEPDLRARITDLPLSIADTFDGASDFQGTLNASADFAGAGDTPDIRFKAEVRDFSTAETRAAALPLFSIASDGETRGKLLHLRTTVTGGEDARLVLAGTAGLSDRIPLDLKIDGKISLLLLADRLSRQGVRLEGSALVDVNVRGEAGAPDITGTVRLADSTLGDTEGRLLIRNLAGTAVIAERKIRVTALTGTMGQKGTLEGRGIVELETGMPADFTVGIRNGTYTDDTLVVATFDADLRFNGELSGASVLGGRIDLVSTLVTLNALPASAIKVQNVTHIHPPLPVLRQQALLFPDGGKNAGAGTGGGGVALDLRIANRGPILVRGRGINADFTGALALSGPVAAPTANGQFDLLRGTIDIIGQTLTFERGSLSFAGSLAPRLDIAVSNNVAGTTVTLALVGPAETPQIVITSSPEIPDEEALALLVFSRQASDLSPLQLARLADALLTLNGGRRTGLFESFRRGLGVDRLDVTTDNAGNSAVGVGRYISNRAYFGVEQGIETGTTKGTINLDITKKLKLQGSVASDGEAKGGIIFQHEY